MSTQISPPITIPKTPSPQAEIFPVDVTGLSKREAYIKIHEYVSKLRDQLFFRNPSEEREFRKTMITRYYFTGASTQSQAYEPILIKSLLV